jgi:hypothetical protein
MVLLIEKGETRGGKIVDAWGEFKTREKSYSSGGGTALRFPLGCSFLPPETGVRRSAPTPPPAKSCGEAFRFAKRTVSPLQRIHIGMPLRGMKKSQRK